MYAVILSFARMKSPTRGRFRAFAGATICEASRILPARACPAAFAPNGSAWPSPPVSSAACVHAPLSPEDEEEEEHATASAKTQGT